MSLLNLDIRAELDINLLAGHSVDFVLEFWQDEACTLPMPLQGVVKLLAKNTVTGTVVDLVAGQGLTVNNNQVAISRTVAQNTFTKGVWSYELRTDLVDGKSIGLTAGKITSNG